MAGSPALRRLGFAAVCARPGLLAPQDARPALEAMADAVGFASTLAVMRHDRFRHAAAVRCPVTVVFGDRDRILPGPAAQVRTPVPPQTRWLVLAGCGHVPMWDAPAARVAVILRTGRPDRSGR